MKKEIQEINMTALNISEGGLDVLTELDAEAISEDDISVKLHVDVGTHAKRSYRYHIEIVAILKDVYDGQDFKNENEIGQYIKNAFSQDIIDLIQCYDRLIINKTYAS